MTICELYDMLRGCAAGVYPAREADAVARYVMEERFGVDRVRLAMDRASEIPAPADLDRLLEELATGRPVQYITGRAWFCGLPLHVGEGVLVPRPETEELVEWVSSEVPTARRVLDIGTGSGAIALALAVRLPSSTVTATDISPAALEIARRNAQTTGLDVRFIQSDILDDKTHERLYTDGGYEVIVSNPPYIPVSAKGAMHRNVTGFEPHGALFVPDERPLLFYEAIAGFAASTLAPGGSLYFEVHEHYGDRVAGMLDERGYSHIEVREDIHGKVRMVRAKLL